jgi:hypothetical protein
MRVFQYISERRALGTYLATTVHDLGLSQTSSRVGLEHVLWANATAVNIAFLLLVLPMAILGLEVLDEGVLRAQSSAHNLDRKLSVRASERVNLRHWGRGPKNPWSEACALRCATKKCDGD